MAKGRKLTLDDCLTNAAKIGAGRKPSEDNDRRDHGRHPYHKDVPVYWLGELNRSSEVALLRASDVSVGGIRLVCRHMLYPGAKGVVQLTRQAAEHAIVGIEVMYTDYIGDMRYASGCRFIAVPQELLSTRFMQGDGGVALMRPGERLARTDRPAA
ncbi:MAG: hypothetical protein IBJ10_08655 [Phycisphaerales bacterium]|nr:hypothetical protein [Phycisphaerales bacterium]